MKRRRDDDTTDTPTAKAPFYDKAKLICETAFIQIAFNRQFQLPTDNYSLLMHAKSLHTGESVAILNKTMERCIENNAFKTDEEIMQTIKERPVILQHV